MRLHHATVVHASKAIVGEVWASMALLQAAEVLAVVAGVVEAGYIPAIVYR
jgi:hypothetical protein